MKKLNIYFNDRQRCAHLDVHVQQQIVIKALTRKFFKLSCWIKTNCTLFYY